MKRSRFTDEQIAYALRQVDGGTAVADVCRQMSVSEATFYVNPGSTEIRELRQLREENAKLKRDRLRTDEPRGPTTPTCLETMTAREPPPQDCETHCPLRETCYLESKSHSQPAVGSASPRWRECVDRWSRTPYNPQRVQQRPAAHRASSYRQWHAVGPLHAADHEKDR
jgi:putative transposase